MKKPYLLLLLLLILSQVTNAQLACPPNFDFELGTTANWRYGGGTCCPIATTPSGPITSRHTITSAASPVDPYGLFPTLCPEGGNFSFKLGNSNVGAEAESMQYHLRVPGGSKSYSIIFRYAVVLEDPNHAPSEQPRFEVKAYDSITGAPVPCAQFSFVASSTLPGFKQSTASLSVYYKPWTMASIDLGSMNGRTVTLDFATGDCSLTGHFGYAYVDINCTLFETSSMDCRGGLTSLSGPPGFDTYQWWDANFTRFYGNGRVIQTPTPSTSTTFAVIVKPYPGFGCPDTLYTVSKAADIKVDALPNDSIICTQYGAQAITLRANASTSAEGLSYKWYPSTGLSCDDCANPTATLNAKGRYVIVVTDSTKCAASDTIDIDIAPNVMAKIKKPKDTVCQYEDVEFFNDVAHVPGVIYHWSLDTALLKYADTTGRIMLNWQSPGKKKVIIRVTNGVCVAYDSVTMYVKPTPLAAFDMKQNACLDEEIEMTPRLADDATYFWTADEQTINDAVYVPKYYLTWSTTGKKRITLSVVGKNGCLQKPYADSIYIHENPVTKIEFANNDRICLGDKITLRVPQGEEYSYSWTPAVYYENNSYHEVVLRTEAPMMISTTVTNRWGCSYTDSAYVDAGLCCKIFCPNAFTPNGDGHNDTYRPVNLEYHKLHTFEIANRWGQIIFRTTNPMDRWDGTFKGVPQETGTYYYHIKYLCDEKDLMEEKGSLTLIR